jgi:hypothetical protein
VAVERAPGGTSLIDVLDRVLDKGIVIDAWERLSLVGIDLITVEARMLVASIDTYLRYSEAVRKVTPASRPPEDKEDDDDDDDDDGGEGSSGAPAMLHTALKPRRRPGSRPQRTRRRKDD